ncbi:MAG: hypothetical protein J4469_04260 [Candidatus Aenigmarchaeota archaeon]|nr:hypothetical protein [Candidatus Aenigmarchaeota archaeon]
MDTTEKLTFGFLGISAIVAIFAVFSVFNVFSFSVDEDAAQNVMGQGPTRMSLSPFDVKLAKEFMDKNGDGKCDSCGMPVEMCIDSGQMQCNMDSKSTIGILGSGHTHADLSIYVNGKRLDESFFASLARDTQTIDSEITSSFVHIENANPPEKVGDIIHMHATGVPLWIFFKSVAMDFNKENLSLPDGRKFSNDDKNTLKFYVNGKPNSEWENYVFSDLDKILISYGDEADLTQQINSITDFSKSH